MSRRSRNPLAGPQVIDLETARRAVAQVAAERDALYQQLERAQGVIASLRRQLEAREAENAHLAQAVRALESRRAPTEEAMVERQSRLLEQAAEERHELHQMLRDLEASKDHLLHQRDEALAVRDREIAARRAAEASLAELREVSPDADRIQRLAADLENLRRRQAAAVEQGVASRTDHLLESLVTVRDSVQRALDTLPGQAGPWHDGLLAVLARVDAVLDREGVTRTGRPGERFDPQLHDAVGTVVGDTDGMVRETVSSGLIREDGRVVVPAKVLVTTTSPTGTP